MVAEDSVAESDLLVDGRDLADRRHPQLFGILGWGLMAGAFVAGAFERPQHLLIKRHRRRRAVMPCASSPRPAVSPPGEGGREG